MRREERAGRPPVRRLVQVFLEDPEPLLYHGEPVSPNETAEKLLSIMEGLNRNRGVTFVFSTHDPRVMERARRLLRMVDGKIESDEKK